MDWNGELDLGRKAPAKKGRRAGISIPFGGQGSETGVNSMESPTAGSLSQSPKRLDLSQPVAPPRSRRTGGWAEDAIKSGKRRNTSSNIIEQERFQSPDRVTKGDSDDDIPVIPELDDMKDDDFSLQIANAPSVAVNRVATYKELDSDLFKHSAFTTIDDVNLQLLAKCLCQESDLKEKDEIWTWDLLFTDVASQLHMDWESEANSELAGVA